MGNTTRNDILGSLKLNGRNIIKFGIDIFKVLCAPPTLLYKSIIHMILSEIIFFLKKNK